MLLKITQQDLRICELCELKFILRRALMSHKLRHTGEKPLSGHKLVSPVLKDHVKSSAKEPQALSHWSLFQDSKLQLL